MIKTPITPLGYALAVTVVGETSAAAWTNLRSIMRYAEECKDAQDGLWPHMVKTDRAKIVVVAHNAWLANDVARCDGSGSLEDGVQYWREGCETCLRRLAPRPEHVVMMAPPPIIAFECEYLIELNDQAEPRRRTGDTP